MFMSHPKLNPELFQPVQNLFHHFAHFLILQCPVFRPEGNGIGHRLIASRDLAAFVYVEKMIAFQQLSAEFVVISAYADFELARQSISLGVAEYILKPVTREDMERTLRRLRQRSGGGGYSAEQTLNLRRQYPDAHPFILRALDMVQNCYAGKINQRELAEGLGISPEYFSYLFSKNIGETFSSFLRTYRIKQAQRLYREGSCDRKDVPYAVGFSDAKYFSQVFRKVTGKSPTEYLYECQKD